MASRCGSHGTIGVEMGVVSRALVALVFLSGCTTLSNQVSPALGGGYTIVRPGESLTNIAWKYQVSVQALQAWNNLGNSTTIHPGQKVYLYGETQAPGTVVAARPVAPVVAPATRPPQQRLTAPEPGPQNTYPVRQKPAVKTLTDTSKKWRWPLRGQLRQRFNDDASGRSGVSIAGKAGENVTAAANGVVAYAGNPASVVGELVIIKHSNEWMSTYTGVTGLLVKEGQNIVAGETIAKLAAANDGSAGLQFEIRSAGKPVDPLQYLP